jgi:hypothetical protein
MRRLVGLVAVLVAVGVLVAVAFGWSSLVLYGFFAVLVTALAVAIDVGGSVITDASSRRFENRERP